MTPCPHCDQASFVDEHHCCVHCGADRSDEVKPTDRYTTINKTVTVYDGPFGWHIAIDGQGADTDDAPYTSQEDAWLALGQALKDQAAAEPVETFVFAGVSDEDLAADLRHMSDGGTDHFGALLAEAARRIEEQHGVIADLRTEVIATLEEATPFSQALVHLHIEIDPTLNADEATEAGYAYCKRHNIPVDDIALVDPQ